MRCKLLIFGGGFYKGFIHFFHILLVSLFAPDVEKYFHEFPVLKSFRVPVVLFVKYFRGFHTDFSVLVPRNIVAQLLHLFELGVRRLFSSILNLKQSSSKVKDNCLEHGKLIVTKVFIYLRLNFRGEKMTRMWMVKPELLCRRHLLGEHNELHKLLGHIRKDNLEVVRGHAEAGDIDTSEVQCRHEELAGEMKRRGYDHTSPTDYEDKLDLGSVDREENLEELKDRCEKCRKRITGSNPPG